MPTLEALAARMAQKEREKDRDKDSIPIITTTTTSDRPRLQSILAARTAQPNAESSRHGTHSDSKTPEDNAAAISPVKTEPVVSNQDDAERDKPKPSKAYNKSVPSLDAITERLARVRARADSNAEKVVPVVEEKKDDPPAEEVGSGQAKEEERQLATAKAGEEAERSIDAASAEASTTAESDEKEHPLQHSWTLFHDSKSRGPPQDLHNNSQAPPGSQSPYIPPPSTETGAYEAGLTVIGDFSTVEGFCRYFNWLKPPSMLERNSNYHLFKDGIKPMWEDEANANGGKWVLTMKSNPALLDRCWTWLAMALVGEELDERDEICGAVVSLRSKIDRIQVWTRFKDDVERINAIGKKLVKILDVAEEPGIGLEFQYNTDDRPTHTKFISIAPPSYYRDRGTPAPATAPSHTQTFGGSAAQSPIGSFGYSGGGSGWRGGRGGRGGNAFGVGSGGGAFGGGMGEPRSAVPGFPGSPGKGRERPLE